MAVVVGGGGMKLWMPLVVARSVRARDVILVMVQVEVLCLWSMMGGTRDYLCCSLFYL